MIKDIIAPVLHLTKLSPLHTIKYNSRFKKYLKSTTEFGYIFVKVYQENLMLFSIACTNVMEYMNGCLKYKLSFYYHHLYYWLFYIYKYIYINIYIYAYAHIHAHIYSYIAWSVLNI